MTKTKGTSRRPQKQPTPSVDKPLSPLYPPDRAYSLREHLEIPNRFPTVPWPPDDSLPRQPSVSFRRSSLRAPTVIPSGIHIGPIEDEEARQADIEEKARRREWRAAREREFAAAASSKREKMEEELLNSGKNLESRQHQGIGPDPEIEPPPDAPGPSGLLNPFNEFRQVEEKPRIPTNTPVGHSLLHGNEGPPHASCAPSVACATSGASTLQNSSGIPSPYNLRNHPKPAQKPHYIYEKGWANILKLNRMSEARMTKGIPVVAPITTGIQDPPKPSPPSILQRGELKPDTYATDRTADRKPLHEIEGPSPVSSAPPPAPGSTPIAKSQEPKPHKTPLKNKEKPTGLAATHSTSTVLHKKMKKTTAKPVVPRNTYLDPASIFLADLVPPSSSAGTETDTAGNPIFKVPLMIVKAEEKKAENPKKKKKDPKPWEEELSEGKLQELFDLVNNNERLVTDQQKGMWFKNEVETAYGLKEISVVEYKRNFRKIYMQIRSAAERHTKRFFPNWLPGGVDAPWLQEPLQKKRLPMPTIFKEHLCNRTHVTTCRALPHRQPQLLNNQQFQNRYYRIVNPRPLSSGLLQNRPQLHGVNRQIPRLQSERRLQPPVYQSIMTPFTPFSSRTIVRGGGMTLAQLRGGGGRLQKPLVGTLSKPPVFEEPLPPIDIFRLEQDPQYSFQSNLPNPFVPGSSSNINYQGSYAQQQQQPLADNETRNTSPLFNSTSSSSVAPPTPQQPQELIEEPMPYLDGFLNPSVLAKFLEDGINVDEVCQLLDSTEASETAEPVEPPTSSALISGSAAEEEEDQQILKEIFTDGDCSFEEIDHELDRYVQEFRQNDDAEACFKCLDDIIRQITGEDADVAKFYEPFFDAAKNMDDKSLTVHIVKEKSVDLITKTKKVKDDIDAAVSKFDDTIKKHKFLIYRVQGRDDEVCEEERKKKKKD